METGEKISYNGSGQFPMESIYKFPIVMAVLRSGQPVEPGGPHRNSDLVPAGLHSPIRDQNPSGGFNMPLGMVLRYAVAESDGTASDVAMKAAGGPAKVTDFLRGLGIKDMVVATTEAEMATATDVQYRNWSTPDAAVQLLTKLNPKQDDLLLRWMVESTPGPKRIKGLLPPGTIVAHKTGTSGTKDGVTFATNDIGLVVLPNGKHMAIAVFASDSHADEATREAVIAKIAKAAWDRFTRK